MYPSNTLHYPKGRGSDYISKGYLMYLIPPSPQKWLEKGKPPERTKPLYYQILTL